MTAELTPAQPAPRLRPLDAIALLVGVVVGVGIFRAPGLVAAGADGPSSFVGLWVLGGALSMIGALCYAELVTAFPSAGGEYHFLQRALGRDVAYLFAWARLSVIGTGSIALLAFVFGDHLATLAPLGTYGSAIYGAVLVVTLVGVNVLGLRFGTTVQNVSTALLVLGLVAVVVAGMLATPTPVEAAAPRTSTVGLAMVFVLLTFGGWNEAAYLSAEVRGGRRRMAAVILAGVGAITAIYVLANVAYVRVLGMDGLRASETVGVDLMTTLVGPAGAAIVSLLVAAAALTSMNATILTVARTAFALGNDVRPLRWLGRWDERASAPVPALLALGAFALALIGLGAAARRGFATMVEYTAPVFWGFFFLTGLSLFVLRRKEPRAERPFRVPLYPVTPLVFCATCAWLLHASLAHTRFGALVGLAVLVLGAVPLWIGRGASSSRAKETADEPTLDDRGREHERAPRGV